MATRSLMLLSHAASSTPSYAPTPTLNKRVTKKAKEFHSVDSSHHGEKKSSYKCKTCNRIFLSFQALGGHRTSCSHTTAESEQAKEKTSSKMGRVHECSICHRVFSSGQALGGHKRTHSTPQPPTVNGYEERGELDLNMPPLDLDDSEDSSKAAPFSTVVRSHYNEYKLSPPFWWMTNFGKRVPSVYNGNIADEAESEVLLGRDLGLKLDLFAVAAVN